MRRALSLVLLAAAALSHAAVVAQWNFNSIVPDNDTTTGSLLPSTGVGTLTSFGGITTTFAGATFTAGGGSTDPAATDNTAVNTASYGAQGSPSGARGLAFAVSTAGQTSLGLSFDFRGSATASKYVGLFYTTNGGASYQLASTFAIDPSLLFTTQAYDFTGTAGALNNAGFGIELSPVYAPGTTAFAPVGTTYGAGGTIRYDMVTFGTAAPVPEPASFAALGMAALVLLRRKRAA